MTAPLNDYDAAILKAAQPAPAEKQAAPIRSRPAIDAFDLGCLAARGIKLSDEELANFLPPKIEEKPVHFCAISEHVNEQSNTLSTMFKLSELAPRLSST